jgi:hypothetical protein
MPLNIPNIDYTSRDWASIRQSLLDDAATRLPEWVNRDPNDFAMVMIEEFAYLGDMLSYYTDRLADESYLPTARNRASILNIADMLSYRPDQGQPSTVTLTIGVVPGTGRVLVPAGTKFSTLPLADDLTSIVFFETDTDLYIDQTTDVAYGTVTATQGETVTNEVLGLSDGTATQEFQLLQAPSIEQTVRVFVDEGAGPMEWMFFEHLIDAQPTALAYTTRVDAFGRTTVRFGDDVNGRVPFNGAAVTVTYRVGGGAVGNVGAGTITNIADAGASISDVNNLGPAVGGTDPETNDQIRVNAPRAMSTLQRAVSLADYGNICFNVVGVAKASAFGLTPNNVTVYIAPSGGGFPTQQLKQRVLAYFAGRKVGPNAQIIVTDPTYVPVNVSVDIMVKPEYAQSPVLNAVKNALIDLLSFANVDFGMLLTVSDVYSALMKVDGVQYAGLRVLARSSDPDPQGIANIQFKPNEIPTATGGVFTVQPTNGIVPSATTPPTAVVPTQPGAPVVDSLTCPTGAAYNGAFDLEVHWAASEHATSYQVILDFYHGTTYRGSYDGPVVATPSASIAAGWYGDADTVKVRVVAINGTNMVDSPSVTVPYTCGTNTMAAPPGVGDLPTALHFTSNSLGAQDQWGNVALNWAVAWTESATPPTKYTYQKRFLDTHGTVTVAGQQQGTALAAAASATGTFGITTDQAPAGAVTMQFRLGIADASGTVVKWTDWVGASVAVYVPPPPPPPSWSGLPYISSASFSSFTRNADGTVSATMHVIADNWQDIRYDWWWQDAGGYVLHSSSPSLDVGYEGGGGSPGVHFDGLITFGSNAPAAVAGHTPSLFVVRLTATNPNGNSTSTLIQHAY